MTPAEDTLRQLAKLGFKNLKIVGQVKDRVIYTHTNGDPVTDAPMARVVGGQVRLEPWTT